MVIRTKKPKPNKPKVTITCIASLIAERYLIEARYLTSLACRFSYSLLPFLVSLVVFNRLSDNLDGMPYLTAKQRPIVIVAVSSLRYPAVRGRNQDVAISQIDPAFPAAEKAVSMGLTDFCSHQPASSAASYSGANS